MLAAALEYSATGNCPVVTSTTGITEASTVKENAVSIQSSTQGSALLGIDNPNTHRETLILHNKINEPVIEERK